MISLKEGVSTKNGTSLRWKKEILIEKDLAKEIISNPNIISELNGKSYLK
jgi:hypothetical protein